MYYKPNNKSVGPTVTLNFRTAEKFVEELIKIKDEIEQGLPIGTATPDAC
jgi:hypothetical protein